MSNKGLVFTLFMIFLALIGGYWFMQVYQPKKALVQEARDHIAKLNKEISENQNIDDELASLEAEYNRVKKELNRYKSLISEESKVPEILEKTESVCKEVKVEFRDIHISPLVEYEGYSEIPIEVGLEGGYHSIGEFMAKMENLRMLNMNSGTISINPKGRPITQKKEDGTSEMVQLLNITLNVRAFILTRGGGLLE